MRRTASPIGRRAMRTTEFPCCCSPTAPGKGTTRRPWSPFSRKPPCARASTTTGIGDRSSSGRRSAHCRGPGIPLRRPNSRPPTAPRARHMRCARCRRCVAIRNDMPTACAPHATRREWRRPSARRPGRCAPRAPGSRSAAQVEARQLVVDVQRRAFECAEAGNPIADAFQSSDPAVRARAVAQWEARLVQNAELGEVAACARTWR